MAYELGRTSSDSAYRRRLGESGREVSDKYRLEKAHEALGMTVFEGF